MSIRVGEGATTLLAPAGEVDIYAPVDAEIRASAAVAAEVEATG